MKYIFVILSSLYFHNVPAQESIFKSQNLNYDFTFVELAIEYLQSGDSVILRKIAETTAAKHIFNHARDFNNIKPTTSKVDFLKTLLHPIDQKIVLVPKVKEAIKYAKEVVQSDTIRTICLESLPKGFKFNGSLYFTFGYDLGVAFKNNSSINLAHSHYLSYFREIKNYAIHE